MSTHSFHLPVPILLLAAGCGRGLLPQLLAHLHLEPRPHELGVVVAGGQQRGRGGGRGQGRGGLCLEAGEVGRGDGHDGAEDLGRVGGGGGAGGGDQAAVQGDGGASGGHAAELL